MRPARSRATSSRWRPAPTRSTPISAASPRRPRPPARRPPTCSATPRSSTISPACCATPSTSSSLRSAPRKVSRHYRHECSASRPGIFVYAVIASRSLLLIDTGVGDQPLPQHQLLLQKLLELFRRLRERFHAALGELRLDLRP